MLGYASGVDDNLCYEGRGWQRATEYQNFWIWKKKLLEYPLIWRKKKWYVIIIFIIYRIKCESSLLYKFPSWKGQGYSHQQIISRIINSYFSSPSTVFLFWVLFVIKRHFFTANLIVQINWTIFMLYLPLKKRIGVLRMQPPA